MSLKYKFLVVVGFLFALGLSYFIYSGYLQKKDEPKKANTVDAVTDVEPQTGPTQENIDPDFSNQEPKKYNGKVLCLRQFQGECVRGLKTWTGKVYELTRFELLAGDNIKEGDKLTVTGYTFNTEDGENTVINVLEYEKN